MKIRSNSEIEPTSEVHRVVPEELHSTPEVRVVVLRCARCSYGPRPTIVGPKSLEDDGVDTEVVKKIFLLPPRHDLLISFLGVRCYDRFQDTHTV